MPGIIKLQLYMIMQLVRIVHCGNTVTGLERGVASCEWPWLDSLDHPDLSTRVTTEARLTRHNGGQVGTVFVVIN